jgi:hypothetical protein
MLSVQIVAAISSDYMDKAAGWSGLLLVNAAGLMKAFWLSMTAT